MSFLTISTVGRRFATPVSIALVGLMATKAACAEDSGTVQALSGRYLNDPAHTRFIWRIQHLGLSNYTARMNNVRIQLQFDAENLESSTVTASIDPKSVDTGYVGKEDFDAKIATNKEILNANAHPAIEFVSSQVTQTGPATLVVGGELTLLGVTRPVTLDVVLSGTAVEHPFAKVPALGFEATATVDRTAYGLDFLSGSGLGDDIEIEIHAEFLKQ